MAANSRKSVSFKCRLEIGEGSANLLETSVLSAGKNHHLVWAKDKIDLQDLAIKRWVERWSMERMTTYFRHGRTTIGITMIRSPLKEAIIGYEVDLNLKDNERYKKTFEYYSNIKPSIVFWLVRNTWMAEKIMVIGKNDFEYSHNGERFSTPVCFILVDEFKEEVWEAKISRGKYVGMSNRIH